MTTLLRERRPVARKRHQCNNCLGHVLPGQTYVSQAIKDGSEFWEHKSHPTCFDLALAIQRAGGWYVDEWPDPSEVQVVMHQIIDWLRVGLAKDS